MSFDLLRPLLHYGIHFGLPILIAFTVYPSAARKALLVLWGGILLDLDHLFATPVFDPNRCSIGFHWLHTSPFIVLYLLLLAFKRTRLAGLACCIHIAADQADCLLMNAQL